MVKATTVYVQARTAVSVKFVQLGLTIIKNKQTHVSPVPQDGPPFKKEENIIGNADIVRISTFSRVFSRLLCVATT